MDITETTAPEGVVEELEAAEADADVGGAETEEAAEADECAEAAGSVPEDGAGDEQPPQEEAGEEGGAGEAAEEASAEQAGTPENTDAEETGGMCSVAPEAGTSSGGTSGNAAATVPTLRLDAGDVAMVAGGAVAALAFLGLGRLARPLRPLAVGVIREGCSFAGWLRKQTSGVRGSVGDIITEGAGAHRDRARTESATRRREQAVLQKLEGIVDSRIRRLSSGNPSAGSDIQGRETK
ncbi:MAG TPA: hypothetical protein VNX25_03000 [Verrucomicrobiae bacterium]|nr:hypothetical protein [Verrucomicrobiae bacterium]